MGAIQGNRETPNETPAQQGFSIDPSELIEEMANKINQLTMDGVVKDIMIRKLQSQLQGGVDG